MTINADIPQPGQLPPRPLTESLSGRPAILLIESDPKVGERVRSALRKLGDVLWVGSAEEAMEVMSKRVWRLIVTEIFLPRLSGLEFLERTKDRYSQAGVIVISNDNSFQMVREAMRLGADDYFDKPINLEELTSKAGELLAKNENPFPKHERVLAIGAHPDDVEIGCGGALLRHHAYGDHIHVLTLSNGSRGGDVGTRIKESRAAAELLGAELHLADLDDTNLTDGPETIEAIKNVIRIVEPTVVYTHSEHDVHQDHRGVNRATITAAREVPRLFCYQAPSASGAFNPAKFISIDAYIEEKLKSIAVFESQASTRWYLDEDLLRSTARYWSRFSRPHRYAEPFEIIRSSDRVADVQRDGVS